MFYDERLVEEVRQANDVVDVIGARVKLQRKGSSHFGLCPFHNEKTPSFSVSQDKQMYYCFGCGASGNVYTFIMEYENLPFVEAIKVLAERVRIALPEPQMSEEAKAAFHYRKALYDANREAARYFYQALQSEKGKVALTYLENRGLTEAIRKRFGLGFSYFFRDDLYVHLKKKGFTDRQQLDAGLVVSDQKGGFRDRFFNRIMFPIFDVQNRIIAFGGRVIDQSEPKYLNSPETKLFEKSKNLYGLNLAKSARKDEIIMVEGYMDVISLHQGGFPQAVASLGTALTGGQANLLKRFTEQVIISYDGDRAGIAATLRGLPILEGVGLVTKVADLEPYKDPDDLIKALGSESYQAVLDTSKPAFIFEIQQLEKQFNLDDPDEKTKFYTEMARRLAHMDNPLKREHYLEVILRLYPIRKDLLVQEMERIGKDVGIVKLPQVQDHKKFNEKPSQTFESEKRLLGFVIGHQDIYAAVKPFLQLEMFYDDTYQKLARLVFKAYESGDSMAPARFINQFLEVDEQKKVAQVFHDLYQVENQVQLEKIIYELTYVIKKHHIDVQARVTKDPLALQQLLDEKRALQQMRLVFGQHNR